MLSDDEAAVFDRLVGELEADAAFTERVLQHQVPVAYHRVRWLLLAAVAVAGSLFLLTVPQGPYWSMAAILVALWALVRATRDLRAGDVARRVLERAEAGRMTWRGPPAR